MKLLFFIHFKIEKKFEVLQNQLLQSMFKPLGTQLPKSDTRPYLRPNRLLGSYFMAQDDFRAHKKQVGQRCPSGLLVHKQFHLSIEQEFLNPSLNCNCGGQGALEDIFKRFYWKVHGLMNVLGFGSSQKKVAHSFLFLDI